MAFIKTRNNFIQKVKIEIGTLMGEQEDKDVYLVLREPTTEQMMGLDKHTDGDEMEIFRYFREILPSLIVEDNFFEDEQRARHLSTKEITDVIFESLEVTSKVFNEFFQASFFTRLQRAGEKSPASARMSSTDAQEQ